VLETLKRWASQLKSQLALLAMATKDPRVPLAAKILAGITLAYALSPIDLIPDFIPVIGLLDDLVLVPLGIWAALRLIPTPLQLELASQISRHEPGPPSTAAAAVIIFIWLLFAAVMIKWAGGHL
jgi:uncharacterized membrane protein YkvA (DUF1232 family)